MQVNVKSGDLKEALRFCSSLHTTATDVLLSTSKEKKKLTIESAEGGSHVKYKIDANVLKDGSVCVNTSYLQGLRLGDRVDLEQDKSKMRFKSGKFGGTIEIAQDTSKLKAQRPINTFDPTISVPSNLIKKMVNSTKIQPSVPNEIMGLKLLVKDDYLVGYCSEKYRACLFKAKCPSSKKLSVVLKPGVLQALTNKLSKQTMLGVKDGIFQLRTAGITCYVPALQKDDVDNIDKKVTTIRDESKKKSKGFKALAEFEVECSSLLKSISNVSSIVIGMLTAGIRLDCEIEDKKLKMSVASSHGKAHATVDIEGGPSKPARVGLSAKSMSEMLSLFSKQKVRVYVYPDFVMVETVDSEACFVMATAQEKRA